MDSDKFNNELYQCIETLVELDDLEEISKVYSLFLSKHNIMPGSVEFDMTSSIMMEALANKIMSDVIINLRNYIDEYE